MVDKMKLREEKIKPGDTFGEWTVIKFKRKEGLIPASLDVGYSPSTFTHLTFSNTANLFILKSPIYM